MNKFRELAVLAAVVSMAFALRAATYKYYLLGTDEFVYYKIGEYILENNEFPYVWYLSNYPEGGGAGQAPLLYYASIFFYSILKFFGFSFLEAFKLAAPIAGALTLVPAYDQKNNNYFYNGKIFGSIGGKNESKSGCR